MTKEWSGYQGNCLKDPIKCYAYVSEEFCLRVNTIPSYTFMNRQVWFSFIFLVFKSEFLNFRLFWFFKTNSTQLFSYFTQLQQNLLYITCFFGFQIRIFKFPPFLVFQNQLYNSILTLHSYSNISHISKLILRNFEFEII